MVESCVGDMLLKVDCYSSGKFRTARYSATSSAPPRSSSATATAISDGIQTDIIQVVNNSKDSQFLQVLSIYELEAV